MTRVHQATWIFVVGALGLLLLQFISIGRGAGDSMRAERRSRDAKHISQDGEPVRVPKANPIDPARRAQSAGSNSVAAPVRFSDLERSPESSRLVHQAQEVVIARCMKSRGHTYRLVEYDARAEAESNSELVAPDDVEASKALGYGLALNLARGEGERVGHDPNAAALEAMSPDELRVFTRALLGERPDFEHGLDALARNPDFGIASIAGGPTVVWDRSSCVSVGRRAIYGDEAEERRLRLALSQTESRIVREVAADPDVRVSLQHWQACMRDFGHRYADPSAASNDLATRFHTGELSIEQLGQAEIQVASADARCQHRSALPATKQAARRRVEVAVAEQEQPLLAQYARMNASSHDAALRLLVAD